MASSGTLRKAVNLSPTIRTLPTGVPYAPRLNLSIRASIYGHDHQHNDHGHGQVSVRSDISPRWTGKILTLPHGNGFTKMLNAPPTPAYFQRFIHTSIPKSDAPQVPSFAPYEASSETANRALSYFMVGSFGVLSASVAKSTVTEFLGSMAASADVLALAKVEVDMNSIPEGKNVIIKWRGKPVFIRHRTADEIKEAREVNWKSFRDPESDEDRTKKPEWLVMIGVCTHLGCVPIGESGDYGGCADFRDNRFCPCHGSHYDISGRARKGPAPLNLEIPEYSFNEDEGKVIIG
ncbi:hsp70 nucleotide exchange factor fes1 [Clathrus columnatus]|uniref:Cytochrome b-c1 complex subunit Rieske, mitochondrial n=1 Tax=Clathrus columnatus TaxID=1419009 RepID=A0AAV5A7M3_9AGAM|nr:hsp70 nucleotide exchange factor fes1 [Clathrus columnatus]